MHRGKNHSRSADAALRRPAFQKRLLHRMQPLIVRQTFNRKNICAVRLQHWNQTTIYQRAIHQDGTGTAFTLPATFLGPGQLQVFAQHVQQSFHRQRTNNSSRAIHRHLNFNGLSFAARNQRDAPADTSSSFKSLDGSITSRISSGSSGTELNSTPNALTIALIIAGAGPSIGSSPIPFAPYAPCGLPSSSKITWMGGRSQDAGMM